jgi:methionyl-tRNA synthetase
MARSKMSKSRGNVVDPIRSMEKWGVDGLRWYLMRAGGSLPDDAGELPLCILPLSFVARTFTN